MPEDEPNQTYDLDLDDDTDEEEREAAIREAMRAVEESSMASRRRRQDETQDEASAEEAPSGDGDAAEESGSVRQLREELDEARERALRILADFENYRKRTDKEREEMRLQAMAEPLRSFLEVVDNLERALHSQASGEDLRLGVEMILKQVRDVNRNFGVEEIDAVGRPFDPTFHDAVARREDPSVDVPTVADELQRGYLHRGRLLRPARVTVAVPPERRAESPEESVARGGHEPDGGTSTDA